MNRMTKIVTKAALAALCVFTGCAPAAAAPAPGEAEVAARTDAYMEALWRVKGFGGAVLVARGDRILVRKGYGMANAELAVPNGADTVFRLGSLTKQFTAAAILLLQQDGKLSVSDRVCAWTDPCPAAWSKITLHHLLTHTSGIANVTALPDWQARKHVAQAPAAVVARVHALPLEFTPGERFAYSNTNYLLLGLVVERAAGEPYERFLAGRIFQPLAMARTGYDHPAELVEGRAAGYARADGRTVNAEHVDMSLPFAAGGLASTVGDLWRWSRALDRTGLLSASSRAAMFTPFRDGYAYGWGTGTLFGRRIAAHTGGIEGFSTHITRFPDEQAVVIVLSNNEAAVANVVANDLAAILFGEEYQVPRERVAVTLAPERLAAYAGAYEIAPGAVLTVALDGPRLTVRAPGQDAAELFAQGDGRFFLRVVDAEIDFVRDAAGAVTGLVLRQNGQAMPARRLP